MAVTNAIPASGSIIERGTPIIVVSDEGTAGNISVTYSPDGGTPESAIVSGLIQTGYSGSVASQGGDTTMTLKRDAGWESDAFSLLISDGGADFISYNIVAEGQYPPFMQPFTDPAEDAGGSGGSQESVVLIEQPDHVNPPTAGRGEIWLKDGLIQELLFTDDLGSDFILSRLSGTVTEDGVLTASGADSGDTTAEVNVRVAGGRLIIDGVAAEVRLAEKAADAGAQSGLGQFWVRDDTPNTPMFTDDAGVDHDLLAGSGDVTSDGTTSQDAALFSERADHVNTPTAGLAELWLKDGTAQELVLTDDFGSDYLLSRVSGTVTEDGIHTSSGASSGDTTSEPNARIAGGRLILDGAAAEVRLSEKAADAGAVAGEGQFWVRDDTPNTPIFTDDAGVDHDLTTGAGGAQTLDDVITGGTPDNTVSVPDADPIVLSNSTGSLATLSVGRLTASSTVPALAVIAEPASLVAKLGTWDVTDVEIRLNGATGAINGSSLSSAPGDFDVNGIGTATQDVDGGDLRLRGGGSNNATSSGTGGNVEIDGGAPLIGGADGDILIGTQNATEIRFGQGFSMEETVSHPVAPTAGRGQWWARSSDNKPIYTTPAGVDLDLSPGAGTLAVEEEGGLVAGGPHSTMNFIGAGVTASDAGGGTVDVTIAPGAAPIDTVFGRTGTVVAVAGDYDASEIGNDSAVSGAFVDDALNTLNSAVGLNTTHSGSDGSDHSDVVDNTAEVAAIRLILPDDTSIVLSDTAASDVGPEDNTTLAGPDTSFHAGDTANNTGGTTTFRGGDGGAGTGGDVELEPGTGVVADGAVRIGTTAGEITIGASGVGAGNLTLNSDEISIPGGVLNFGDGIDDASLGPVERTGVVAGTNFTIKGGAADGADAGGDLILEGGDSASGTDGKVTIGVARTSAVDVGADLGITGDIAVSGTVDGVDVAQLAIDNTGDVTLAGTPDYLTLSGQEITLNKLDVADDVNSWTHAQLNAQTADGTDIFDSGVSGQVAALTTKASPTGADWVPIGDTAASGGWKKAAWPSAASEDNDLEAVCTGIADNEVPVGTGADTASYLALPTNGAVAFNGTAFSQAGVSDLSGTPTGTGDIVLESSPTIVTPTIASFTNAQHDHADAAGGGTIAYAAITGTPAPKPDTVYIETPTNGDVINIGRADRTQTIASVHAVLDDGTSVVVSFDSGASRATSDQQHVNAQTCSSTTTGTDLTKTANLTFDSGDWRWFTIGTVTGTTGMTITVSYS